MDKVELLSRIDLGNTFTDVLYFTNHDQIPHEIKKLFKQKKNLIPHPLHR